MEQEKQLVLIVTTGVVVLVTVFLIILFVIFQRRKNKLLTDRVLEKKRFEREIIETQVEIREETLRNISWELHDNIGQLLTLAKIQVQHTCCPEDMKEATDTLTKTLTEIRSLSKLINPEFINQIKLTQALDLEVKRYNRLNYINSTLTINGEEKIIQKKHSIIIFRILQEFASNSMKHAKAPSLNFTLNFKEKELEVIAEDDGVGFEIEKVTNRGIGLQNMKSRAKLINAEINLDSIPKQGTTLKIKYYFSD